MKLTQGSVTARIKELLDEGLLVERGTVLGTAGVRVKALYVGENDAGNPRDRVRVHVEILVDADGNYYADAHVVGGKLRHRVSGTPRTIHSKEITVVVPKLRDVVDEPVRVSSPTTLTIEGDYRILK